jgi:hypothetical protein
MYDRTSTATLVNEARLQLFSQKGRAFDNIAPTQAVLLQHVKRAVYQAGYCWGQVMIVRPQLPCPSEWEWEWGWQSRSPSLRSSERNVRLWDNPFQGGI